MPVDNTKLPVSNDGGGLTGLVIQIIYLEFVNCTQFLLKIVALLIASK